MLLRRFSTKQLPSSNIHDFLVKANAYHPKQTSAIASSQHMLHLLHPYLEQKTTSSPFTKIAMERKLSHWKTLTTNSKDTETVKLPTLDARGMHFWTQSNEEKIGSNVALSFSHAISEYLPEEKVHRTTLPDFLGFVRQQLKTWQDQRRTDMMTPDVLDVNLDGGDNGKYSSERAAREWSTVVLICINPPSFNLFQWSLSRISSILKHPNKSFFNVINILDSFTPLFSYC